MNNVIIHAGDIGDAIAMLPTLRKLGGGNIVFAPLLDGKFKGRESMKGARFEALKPLLEAQPYIGSVTWEDAPLAFTHDLRDFRQDERPGESLLEWQARYLGITPSAAPWLQCARSEVSLGRAVVSRSLRYRNGGFPWNAVLNRHRHPIFIGLEEEYVDFQRHCGRAEFIRTPDLLTAAEIIAGADIFIGNQSAPFWIAAGLGVRILQESWPPQPNSQIVRPNARYMIRGPFNL